MEGLKINCYQSFDNIFCIDVKRVIACVSFLDFPIFFLPEGSKNISEKSHSYPCDNYYIFFQTKTKCIGNYIFIVISLCIFYKKFYNINITLLKLLAFVVYFIV